MKLIFAIGILSFSLTRIYAAETQVLHMGIHSMEPARSILINLYDEVNRMQREVRFECHSYPMKRTFLEMEQGALDGDGARILGVLELVTNLSTHFTQLSCDFGELTFGLYLPPVLAKKGNKVMDEPGLKIAVLRGEAISMKTIPMENTVQVESYEQAWQLLVRNRVDGMGHPSWDGVNFFPLPSNYRKAYQEVTLIKTRVAPLLNKKWGRAAAVLCECVFKMRKSGRFESILRQSVHDSR